jgi:hypothetical protein
VDSAVLKGALATARGDCPGSMISASAHRVPENPHV